MKIFFSYGITVEYHPFLPTADKSMEYLSHLVEYI